MMSLNDFWVCLVGVIYYLYLVFLYFLVRSWPRLHYLQCADKITSFMERIMFY